MADENSKWPSWIGVHLVAPAVSIVSAVVIGITVINSSIGKTDQTAQAVYELKSEVRASLKDIQATLATIPGDQVRLKQLEEGRRDVDGTLGALDARMNLVERKTDVNTAAIDSIRAASGVRLRP